MREDRPELSYPQYLAIENQSEIKHEWVDGQMYAMAGATLRHNQLAAQMIMELGRAIGDGPCTVFTSDQRVRSEHGRFASYPDVVVVCGAAKTHDEDPIAATNPVVLVEVLSESTEKWDRSGKFRRYRRIDSLQHYVLVSQSECSIEVYSREGDTWVLREYSAGDRAALAAINGAVEVDRVYRGVTFEPSDERP